MLNRTSDRMNHIGRSNDEPKRDISMKPPAGSSGHVRSRLPNEEQAVGSVSRCIGTVG